MPLSPGARTDLRPLGVSATVAVAASLLLVQAVRHGWLGVDAGCGAEFCERWHDAGLLKQPVNTLSNAGFVVVGLAIAWTSRQVGARGEGPLGRTSVVSLMATVVVLLGPASAAMHATGSQAGRSLDLLSMHLVAGFAAAYAVARSIGAPRLLLPCFVVLVLAAQTAALVPGEVPVVRQPENVTFAALLLVTVLVEQRTRTLGRGRLEQRWLAAALGTLAVAFVVWNLDTHGDTHGWCAPDSWVQGHAMWHLLCALACWFLFRFYASERSSPGSRSVTSAETTTTAAE